MNLGPNQLMLLNELEVNKKWYMDSGSPIHGMSRKDIKRSFQGLFQKGLVVMGSNIGGDYYALPDQPKEAVKIKGEKIFKGSTAEGVVEGAYSGVSFKMWNVWPNFVGICIDEFNFVVIDDKLYVFEDFNIEPASDGDESDRYFWNEDEARTYKDWLESQEGVEDNKAEKIKKKIARLNARLEKLNTRLENLS